MSEVERIMDEINKSYNLEGYANTPNDITAEAKSFWRFNEYYGICGDCDDDDLCNYGFINLTADIMEDHLGNDLLPVKNVILTILGIFKHQEDAKEDNKTDAEYVSPFDGRKK